jgi:hypothetical protein
MRRRLPVTMPFSHGLFSAVMNHWHLQPNLRQALEKIRIWK